MKLSNGSVIAETSMTFNSSKDSTTLKNDVLKALKNGNTTVLAVDLNSIKVIDNTFDNTQSKFFY